MRPGQRLQFPLALNGELLCVVVIPTIVAPATMDNHLRHTPGACVPTCHFGDAPQAGGEWHLLDIDPSLVTWLNGDYRKICVGSESELLELHARAKKENLRCSLVRDLGHTEFGGVPTYTAVAIGPADAEAIDAITGTLRLL